MPDHIKFNADVPGPLAQADPASNVAGASICGGVEIRQVTNAPPIAPPPGCSADRSPAGFSSPAHAMALGSSQGGVTYQASLVTIDSPSPDNALSESQGHGLSCELFGGKALGLWNYDPQHDPHLNPLGDRVIRYEDVEHVDTWVPHSRSIVGDLKVAGKQLVNDVWHAVAHPLHTEVPGDKGKV